MKNINIKPTIKAIDKNHLKQLISDEIKINGYECDLNFINTSDIDSMAGLFYETQFNGDISNWNTSNVKNMYGMFSSSCFTGDISNWDTSNVEDMKCMFYYSTFNSNISKWNTSNVKNMEEMFYNSKFNGDISDWDIQNVIEIDDIFYLSKSKNIPYWAKIEDNNERIKAYQTYHYQKEKDIILNNLNNNVIIKQDKNIIKI